MTLRHLETFLAIVDAGCSVTRAAERLHVVQPAVSRTLADLEEHYGTRLFERLGRHLQLTAAGERLLGEARRLADGFRDLELAMRAGTASIPLRIGATYTVGTTFLCDLLAMRRAAPDPRCPVIATVRNTDIVEKALVNGELDAGIVEGAIRAPELVETKVDADRVIAVAAPGTAARAGRNGVLPPGIPRILREPGSGTHDAAAAVFPARPEDIEWTVANTQTMIQMARAGLGVAFLSELLVRDELARGTLVAVGNQLIDIQSDTYN